MFNKDLASPQHTKTKQIHLHHRNKNRCYRESHLHILNHYYKTVRQYKRFHRILKKRKNILYKNIRKPRKYLVTIDNFKSSQVLTNYLHSLLMNEMKISVSAKCKEYVCNIKSQTDRLVALSGGMTRVGWGMTIVGNRGNRGGVR